MILFLTAALVLAADQLSKLWIRSFGEGQVIFEAGPFRILHITNTGAAFGLLQDQSLFLTFVAVFGIILVLTIAFFGHRLSLINRALDRLALGLILGGATGNLTDRIRIGHVTDFISVSIWPTFNVADSAVTIGVILFACLFLFAKQPENKPSPANPEA